MKFTKCFRYLSDGISTVVWMVVCSIWSKIKKDKRDRETDMESDGGFYAISYRIARKSMTNKVIFEQRTKGNEGLSHVDMWEKNILGWLKSKCKGPGARRCLACIIKRKKPVYLEYVELEPTNWARERIVGDGSRRQQRAGERNVILL